MIRAVALDDEPLSLEILQSYCDEVDFITLKKTFTQTRKAREYLRQDVVDLIFLDIQMPAISGIDFFKELPENTLVIFTTAYSQYVMDGLNLKAVDYLLKPYSLERFITAVGKARSVFENEASHTHEGT